MTKIHWNTITCTRVFTAILSITAPNCKQPKCPFKGKWISKFCTLSPWNTTKQWTGTNYWYNLKDLRGIMLNEKTQSQKVRYYMIPERTFTKWHNNSNREYISDCQGWGLVECVWLRGIRQLIGGDGTVLHADCDSGYSIPHMIKSHRTTHT